ncbi:hypothetical protein F4813DRAFT_392658 [Daldinia decipiens]|uniref:uncharacterized protein n=1 Tax=Daldinia decipiens TaxID=326647 RepID=UPI0020C29DCC|nr:uncharacterized protein F4813DRAFT_392658 [Daldinia decipiens]KAI1654410.1 hypothetical protein F4813DRAFT_392658 [Daldinia decipiens]
MPSSHGHGSKKPKKYRGSSKDKDSSDMYMERHKSDRSHVYVVHERGVGSESSGSHSYSHSGHHSGHHGSHYEDSGGANNPSAEPVTSAQPPDQPTIPEEPPDVPQPAPMNEQASFTDQPGYQTINQPVSGGRSVRVSVGTGYTANGVAPQAGNYYPPSQNPFANYNNQAGPSQAVDPDYPEDYPEGDPGNYNGLGLGWSQPDPYGRQYLHEKKHRKKHHHHHHHH